MSYIMTLSSTAATLSCLSDSTLCAPLHKEEERESSPGAGAGALDGAPSLTIPEPPKLVADCSLPLFACGRAGSLGGRTAAAGATLSSSADALLT